MTFLLDIAASRVTQSCRTPLFSSLSVPGLPYIDAMDHHTQAVAIQIHPFSRVHLQSSFGPVHVGDCANKKSSGFVPIPKILIQSDLKERTLQHAQGTLFSVLFFLQSHGTLAALNLHLLKHLLESQAPIYTKFATFRMENISRSLRAIYTSTINTNHNLFQELKSNPIFCKIWWFQTYQFELK